MIETTIFSYLLKKIGVLLVSDNARVLEVTRVLLQYVGANMF